MPSRIVPRAYILGTLALTLIYLVVNVGYVFSLSLPEMAGETRIAEKAMTTLIGPFGATFMAAVVVISTLGCNVAGMLAMSRACYAMALTACSSGPSPPCIRATARRTSPSQ